MMPSSTTNSSINNNDRKRRCVSSNSKKPRRSELINNSKTERLSRSSSMSNTFTKINHMTQPPDISRFSTLRQINDSYDKNESNNGLNEIKSTYESDEEFDKTKTNLNKIPSVVVSPIITSTDRTKNFDNHNSSTKLFKFIHPQSTSIKMLSNVDGLSSALRIPTKIQLTKTLSSIHQESSTSTEKEQTVEDYPLTPPPPIIENSRKINQNLKHFERNKPIDSEHQILSKRHSFALADWSVPPTSELSPTSLSPDDSFVELDFKINQISSSSSIKRRYRSLSFSCPILPYCIDKTKPITPPYKSKSLSRISNSTNKKLRSMSPVIKYSSIERLKRRRRDHQIYGKRLKLKSKIEDENIFIIQNLLNEMIEQIDDDHDKTSKLFFNTSIPKLTINESPSTKSIPESTKDEQGVNDMNHQEINNENKTIHHESFPLLSTELKRQTSTPLSFHSIASSSTDDQSINSPHSVSKTHIFTDIVNELIKGAKGLDKLSCSLINFTNSIHNFIRLTIEKQTEKVENLQRELEKKCSSQLNRANIFCTKKIQYFIDKHSIISLNEHINEISLIVKYFYLYVLSLNYRKQENEYESILNDLINEKYTFINELFSSSVLTTIIEDFILTSSLANDYLSAQPILINQIEYSLPLIRNLEYENELLYKNDTLSNPFSDFNDLDNYLHCCERIPTSIPYYPVQQATYPPVYYPSSGQYYYPSTPSSDLTPYYYHHHSHYSYGYNHPSPYYNPYNEQYNYYYNQQTSYNSTNDIPLSNNNFAHQSYRRVNSNVQKKYSNQPPETPISAVFEPSNIDSAQSKSTASTNPIYP